jgi:predicted nucleic acid-binding protein
VSLVLDASLTVAWYFEGEGTAATDAVLDQVSICGAMAPGVWPLEVANALLMAVRRKRIDGVYRDAALAELALLPIGIDSETGTYAWSTTLRLAERFALTLYDASYLELAQRRSLPLATLDAPLRKAAEALHIRVLG